MSVTLTLPPTIITGAGASEKVGEQAKRLGATNALIVTDPGIAKIGYADQIAQNLHTAGISTVCFSDVTPDPTLKNVRDGLKQYLDEACDLIVSIGGGSAIDCGKGIAMKLTNSGDFEDYMGVDNIPNPGAPLIAIPTTGGTGSEVSKVTVITDTERNIKMMLSSACLLAHVALVDPLLSLTTPPHLTAAVGVDALTHAIEAYISKRAQPITDALALKAIAMISGSLTAGVGGWRKHSCTHGYDDRCLYRRDGVQQFLCRFGSWHVAPDRRVFPYPSWTLKLRAVTRCDGV